MAEWEGMKKVAPLQDPLKRKLKRRSVLEFGNHSRGTTYTSAYTSSCLSSGGMAEHQAAFSVVSTEEDSVSQGTGLPEGYYVILVLLHNVSDTTARKLTP